MTGGRPKVLVLDIDDTLFLERDFARSGFLATGLLIEEKFEKCGFGETCWELFVHGERRTIFDQALSQAEIPADQTLMQLLVKTYREHDPAIGLMPDALQLLHAAYRTIPIAAISDGPLLMQQNKARALHLDHWIETILLTDRWGPGASKPNQRCFLEVERVHQAKGRDCIYVGDNPRKDFIAPNELGWRSVRIRRELGIYHLEEPDTGGEPDIELTDLSPLLDMFNFKHTQ